MITQCQKVNFRLFCTERGSYMNMFLWLLDFVTLLNNFFGSFIILVYNKTILSLRLIVYYLIIANSGFRPPFAICQTIYNSPSRDNCKIIQTTEHVSPELIVSEIMSILQKNPDFYH